jgi:Cu-processing system permease protein
MNAIRIIAIQEIRDGLRNKWVVAAALVLALFALSIAFLGSTAVGTVNAPALAVVVVSLSSLTVFLVPLLGLMLSYDAIVGESERGTLLLLLSYPMRRWQFLFGKFIGQVAILMFAILVGYGVAGLAVAWQAESVQPSEIMAFTLMMGSAVVMGAAFVALGHFISAAVRERATAAGLALGIWLLSALVYDLVLLGTVAADSGGLISENLFSVLLLINPTDAFRLLNLASFDEVANFAGTAGLASTGTAAPTLSALSLVCWIAAPLGLAALVFRRREI